MLFDELISRPSDRELRKIVMKWWNIYENNKKIGLNDLAMILLHSAGIKHKTFDMTILRDGFFKRNIFSKDHDLSNAPISLQQFSKILNKFLDILLQKNFWTIIQDLSFIFDLVSVIEFMKESPHDSVRAVSYLSGMKILRQSYYFSEYLITANIPNKTTIIQKIEELKSKLHNNFRHSMRDKSAYLRMIPLKELLFWSGDNPDIMIEEYIRKYILRALRDSFIVNRKIALNIFCKIFENPSVFNREKQQNLFSKLIPELTISLRSNEELDFLILKIMNQASKFLDVVVTPEEELNISMCLYSENESVLDEAKIYFYNNYFKGKVGVNIISETFKFYRKCPVKNTTQFVKNLVSYYADHTTWQDWEFCLKSCCDNDINDYLNIFYHYVTFINRPSLNDLDSSTKNKMRDQFSVSFSKCWLQLMETDKIAMNSYAQVFMLKLATSFNILKLSKKINTTIIDWSLKNFLQGNNHEVLKECLLCIHFLNSFNTNILIEKMLISHVLTGFIELLKNENEETEIINLSHYKVHLLVNTYEDSYENLWESLVSLLEKESDLKKVQLIISVLHHLVMNKMKKYIDFLNIEEKSSQCFILKVQITSYSAIVIKAASNFISNAYQHINENGNLAKMMWVPKLYGDLIRSSKNPSLSELLLELSDANVELYAIYCSRIMNTDCQRKGPNILSNCCILLNDYAALTVEGKISISYLKFFIENFQKINSHWSILIKVFNFLINIKHNPLGAYAIINGLISLYNEEKDKCLCEETIKSKLSEVTMFILNNIADREGKGYQITVLHLYLYLEKLLKEGNIVFMELVENIKSFLSDEIRMKLMCKNPCIQL